MTEIFAVHVGDIFQDRTGVRWKVAAHYASDQQFAMKCEALHRITIITEKKLRSWLQKGELVKSEI